MHLYIIIKKNSLRNRAKISLFRVLRLLALNLRSEDLLHVRMIMHLFDKFCFTFKFTIFPNKIPNNNNFKYVL